MGNTLHSHRETYVSQANTIIMNMWLYAYLRPFTPSNYVSAQSYLACLSMFWVVLWSLLTEFHGLAFCKMSELKFNQEPLYSTCLQLCCLPGLCLATSLLSLFFLTSSLIALAESPWLVASAPFPATSAPYTQQQMHRVCSYLSFQILILIYLRLTSLHIIGSQSMGNVNFNTVCHKQTNTKGDTSFKHIIQNMFLYAIGKN